MKKLLILILLITPTLTVFSGEIYKWKDKNGRIHYSEKSGAPNQSEKIVTQDQASQNQGEKIIIKNKSPQEKDAKIAGMPINECARLARILADDSLLDKSKQLHPDESLRIAKEIQSLCPGKSIVCQSLIKSPERNLCKMVDEKDPNKWMQHQVHY